MGVSFKSPQLQLSSELLSRPQFFASTHGQAVTSTFVVVGALWGLAVLRFKAKLPFHVNDANILRILKETPMAWLFIPSFATH
jgi:hypothetical protein